MPQAASNLTKMAYRKLVKFVKLKLTCLISSY